MLQNLEVGIIFRLTSTMNPPSNSFRALSNLISVLKTREISYIRAHVLPQPQRGQLSNRKASALFEHLLSEPDLSAQELAQNIYAKNACKAFKHLRIRLFNKILDSLGNESLNGRNCHAEQLRKGQEGITILWERGAYTALDAAIPTIFRLAEKSEDFKAQCMLLSVAIQLASLRGQSCQQLQSRLDEALVFQNALQQLNRYAFPILPGAYQQLPAFAFELAGQYKNLRSKRVKFLCLLLLGIRSLNENNLEHAFSISAQLHQFIAHAPQLFDDQAQFLTKCFAAQLTLQADDPHQTLSVLSKEANHIAISPPLFWQIQQLKAEALCHTGNPKLGYALFHKLLESSKAEPCLAHTEVRLFLASKAALQAQLPSQCLSLLSKITKNLLKDPKWNLAFRILQIQALITLQQYDLAELRIEALRKFQRKLDQTEALVQWYFPIVQLLIRLVRKNFAFQEFTPAQLSQIKMHFQPNHYPHRGNFNFIDWWKAQTKTNVPILKG